jgi:DMSO/TMAO reductase YedYZ molybdopterin-dependent catalytic subunit
MTSRAVNLAIFVIVLVEFASGVTSLLVSRPDGAWLFWVHRAGGLALVVLLAWKWRIVLRSYRRHGLTPMTALAALLSLLYVATLASGVAWATVGFPGLRLPGLGGLTGLGVHILLALLLIPLFALHAAQRWPRLLRADLAGRRAALRYLALSAAGLALSRGHEAVTQTAGLSGQERRFTGSRERGSFSGNGYPVTNWLTDKRQRLDPDAWRLRVHGRVEREVELSLAGLQELPATTSRAVLDCTGGWFTEQDWRGVPLAAVLSAARPRDGARSLLVTSATGYRRRFPISNAGKLLLGAHASGEALSAGHGAPVRLIAPGERGFNWVKWVVDIEVSESPAWLQSPLPLQ